MTSCLIVGAGTSKPLANEYPHLFSISANLHFPNANVIFAQDDPILDKIFKKGVDGFRSQAVFTTPQKYRKYADERRCLPFNYRHFYNTSSLSSGLNAIVLAQFFGFKDIVLAGFDFGEVKQDYKTLFDTVKGSASYKFLKEDSLL